MIIKSESGKVLKKRKVMFPVWFVRGNTPGWPCSPCPGGKGNLGERWEACLGVCVVSRFSIRINCILHVQQAIRGVHTSTQMRNRCASDSHLSRSC